LYGREVNNKGGILFSQPRPNLGQIDAYYKYPTTSQINQIRNMPGARFWQQRYYDHIVRNESELDAIHHYIVNNHLKWEEDQENPRNWETS
jgi:REP element-mobilizing transposase RayT